MTTATSDYHALRARHEAMLLRRRMLSPGFGEGKGGVPALPAEIYDGKADQIFILEHLDLVEPFEELIDHLYQAMFARHPSLRDLFPASMEYQRTHLARAFRYLVENLDRPEEIRETFARLGRDHRKLGLLPGQYTAFETALREALRVRTGARWSDELEQAWVRMLRFAIDAMVRGADEALHEPPCWNVEVTDHQLRSPDLAVIRVRPHEEFPHRAGRHVALESPLLPNTWRRYYPVRVPGRDGELEFHVRRVAPGGVSDALVRGTAPGDTLRMGPSKGNLTPGEDTGGSLVLVAWDTGWAAMKALLLDVEAGRARLSGRRVRLFVGSDAFAGFYDAEHLSALERHRSWLSVVPVTGSRPGEDLYEPLLQAVAGSVPGPADRVLVAGPPAPVRAVAAALIRAGVPASQVVHDLPPGSH